MTALTDRLDQWAALAEKATEGPWRVDHTPIDSVDGVGGEVGVETPDGGMTVWTGMEGTDQSDTDAAFIAASRTALPAAIEALQAVLALAARLAADSDDHSRQAATSNDAQMATAQSVMAVTQSNAAHAINAAIATALGVQL